MKKLVKLDNNFSNYQYLFFYYLFFHFTLFFRFIFSIIMLISEKCDNLLDIIEMLLTDSCFTGYSKVSDE